MIQICDLEHALLKDVDNCTLFKNGQTHTVHAMLAWCSPARVACPRAGTARPIVKQSPNEASSGSLVGWPLGCAWLPRRWTRGWWGLSPPLPCKAHAGIRVVVPKGMGARRLEVSTPAVKFSHPPGKSHTRRLTAMYAARVVVTTGLQK